MNSRFFLLAKDMFLGKKFDIKQLKMNKFIKFIRQMIISTSNATLELLSPHLWTGKGTDITSLLQNYKLTTKETKETSGQKQCNTQKPKYYQETLPMMEQKRFAFCIWGRLKGQKIYPITRPLKSHQQPSAKLPQIF